MNDSACSSAKRARINESNKDKEEAAKPYADAANAAEGARALAALPWLNTAFRGANAMLSAHFGCA